METQSSLSLSGGLYFCTWSAVAPHLTLHTRHNKLLCWALPDLQVYVHPILSAFLCFYQRITPHPSRPSSKMFSLIAQWHRVCVNVLVIALVSVLQGIGDLLQERRLGFISHSGQQAPQRLLVAEAGSELSRMPSFSQAGSRSHHTVLQSAGSGFVLSICFLRKVVLKSLATGILSSLPSESQSPPLPL